MTTITVARRDDAVAIGADTLTKFGYSNQRADYIVDSSKIIQVGHSHLALTGHASWGEVLTSYFSSLRRVPTLASAQEIFQMSRRLHEVLKDDYCLNATAGDSDAFESSQFSCLVANPTGIYGLYSRRSVQEFTRFYAFGSGRYYALGAMHAAYERAGSAEEVARAGLEAAAVFDENTAAPLELITVPLATPAAIEALPRTCEARA